MNMPLSGAVKLLIDDAKKNHAPLLTPSAIQLFFDNLMERIPSIGLSWLVLHGDSGSGKSYFVHEYLSKVLHHLQLIEKPVVIKSASWQTKRLNIVDLQKFIAKKLAKSRGGIFILDEQNIDDFGSGFILQSIQNYHRQGLLPKTVLVLMGKETENNNLITTYPKVFQDSSISTLNFPTPSISNISKLFDAYIRSQHETYLDQSALRTVEHYFDCLWRVKERYNRTEPGLSERRKIFLNASEFNPLYFQMVSICENCEVITGDHIRNLSKYKNTILSAKGLI